jgi:hypothetical protein
MRLRFWMLTFSLPILANCASQPSSAVNELPEIGITHAVLAYYEQYRNEQSPMAFAVSQDGRWASYIYCEARRCVGGGHATSINVNDAIGNCNEKASEHGSCSAFAMGVGAPRKYHLID